MVKVKIEVNGEEKQVITGDMVNAVVLDENGCKIALVSDPSEQGIATGRCTGKERAAWDASEKDGFSWYI